MAVIRVSSVGSDDNIKAVKDKYYAYLKKDADMTERRQARVRKHKARTQ